MSDVNNLSHNEEHISVSKDYQNVSINICMTQTK